MAYQELTQWNSPNYTPNSQVRYVYGMPRSIEGITVHWWGDPNTNPSFEGVVNWLCRANGGSSAHAVATGTPTKRVAWLVNAVDAAWHAGNAQGNSTTIGIECDPRARNEDYDTVAELIADLWIAYNRKLPLYPHRYWMSTACPGGYDLDRLNREAETWYNRKIVAPPKWTPMDNPRILRAATDLFVINLDDNTKVGNVIKAGTDIAFNFKKDQNNTTYLRSVYSTTNNMNRGIDIRSLKEVPVPLPEQPEWIRNLKDKDAKLTVLPADGTKVIDLNTLKPVNNNVIPKGTPVDIVKETTIADVKYYISKWSSENNVANGLLATDLGVPIEAPIEEKPEWLKNLTDIKDQTFWTRSDTPVLNIENGNEISRLPINTKVLVTHATSIVGIDYLVLDGVKEVINPLYLSDKEIADPDSDIKSRISWLEKVVKEIIEFLSSIFSNFKVK